MCSVWSLGQAGQIDLINSVIFKVALLILAGLSYLYVADILNNGDNIQYLLDIYKRRKELSP